MHPLTQREIEIEKLREQGGLTFKEIGLRFHINASRASFLYRQIRRKRNEQRRQEQNVRSVSIKLTSEKSYSCDVSSQITAVCAGCVFDP